MSHPLVLALYPNPTAAAAGARALHEAGVSREHISVLSRNHDEQTDLAEALDATPGGDIEDSRPAAVLGELGGQVLAAIALVMPGIGPIVTAGPLSAELGEAAGHMAGGIASALSAAGVDPAEAETLERDVKAGAVLLAVHTTAEGLPPLRAALAGSGASRVLTANWEAGS